VRIAIVGGGPGGLYLSALLKRAHPTREVIVFEQNPPGVDYGFGVVFSDNTLSSLERYDPGIVEVLSALGPSWDHIQVALHGDVIRCGGIGFTSIGRARLLQHLTELAAGAGVSLRFEEAIGDRADIDADLVVGADGVNSTVRSWSPQSFGYRPTAGEAKFIWLGTTKLYDCLTFTFRASAPGAFGVHAYPFDEETSTFLVETDPDTWRAAGLDAFDPKTSPPGESDDASVAFLAELFDQELAGEELLASNSKWLDFVTVRNERWSAGDTVLIGDAAHTAHFSVGSGTRMAMEDALELSRAIDRESDLTDALNAYEQQRRPEVERIQQAAAPSQRWWERFHVGMDWELERFTFNFLTRTPRVTRHSLIRRDARFVRAVDEWWQKSTDLVPRGDTRLAAPLLAPLGLRGIGLPNRVAVNRSAVADGGPTTDHLVELGGLARCGAGLVLSGPVRLSAQGPIDLPLLHAANVDAWGEITHFIHERSRAVIGLRCTALDPEAAPEMAAIVEGAGFDLLELAVTPGSDPAGLTDLVAAYRSAWPEDLPLAVGMTFAIRDGIIDEEDSLAAAEAVARGGCDLLALSSPADSEPQVAGRDRWRPLAVSERVRNELEVATLLVGVVRDRDEAASAIVAGRADLCAGRPDLASPAWTEG
jgi:anthraniloyl-CoA monooxygenase